MKKRLIGSLVVMGSILSTSVFANCPTEDQISYSPTMHAWVAPGFLEVKEFSADEKPAAFDSAHWITKEGVKPRVGVMGSVVCSYKGATTGNIVNLMQEAWAKVPYPAWIMWQNGYWQQHLARVCKVRCVF